MKKMIIIALGALALASGAAMAAPGKPGYGHQGRGISPGERIAIARSEANLAQMKRRAWADGRLSITERIAIRVAEARHAALVRRARLS